jgi:hypothetical protein
MTTTRGRLDMARTILTGHYPAMSAHCRQLRLFLQVLELGVTCVMHRRLFGVSTRMTAFPFTYGVITVEDRCKITLSRWVRCTEMGKSSKSGWDGVHLIDGVGSVAG